MTALALELRVEEDRVRRSLLANAQRLHELLTTDPRGFELLRALRTTEYHWIGTRGDGQEPITGGRHADFMQMREECEMILDGRFDNVTLFRGIGRIDIVDAVGAHVWSRLREATHASD